MVKPTPRALKEKRKSDQIEIATPPSGEVPSLADLDFESSYLSICCLVQNESQASEKLVIESQVLSRMLERITGGTPRDIEELTLGAISGALSWVPVSIVQRLIEQGLLEYCHQVIQRYVARGTAGRTPDRGCEIALDILRDLVHLEDGVVAWMLNHLADYVTLTVVCPVTFPAVTVKRSCARLMLSLVEAAPAAFVPGLPDSRLPAEAMQGLFQLCNSEDLESSCYLILCGLVLEKQFGSRVVPTSTSIALDIIGSVQAVIREAASFTKEPTDEEALRLDQWRSKLRGVATLVGQVGDTLEDLVSDAVEKDSVEDKSYGFSKEPASPSPELALVPRLSSVGILVDDLEKLVSLIDNRQLAGETEEGPAPAPSPTGKARISVVLEDRDLENVFELVGVLMKINKIRALRFKTAVDPSVVGLAVTVLGIFVRYDSDITIISGSAEQCLETVSWYSLAVAAKRIQDSARFVPNTLEFINAVVKKYAPQSVARIDNRHVVSDDDEEEMAAIPVCLMEILQLVGGLAAVPAEVRLASAEATLAALSALTETNITSAVSCAIVETMFVVFGEADHDQLLASVDWVARLSAIAVFLNSRLAVKKMTRNDRSQYIQGTVENIKAFVHYKRSSV